MGLDVGRANWFFPDFGESLELVQNSASPRERCSSLRPVSAGCSQSYPDKRRRATGEDGTDDLGLIFLEITQGAST